MQQGQDPLGSWPQCSPAGKAVGDGHKRGASHRQEESKINTG